MKRILAVAGGGSKGDEIAGIHDALRRVYDVYIGTSTGALIALLLACKKYDELVEGYSTITNRQVYGLLRPFNKNGSWSSRSLLKLWRLGPFASYFYDISKDLEKRVRKYFTKEDFEKLRRDKIEVIVCIEDLGHQNDKPEYVSVLDPSLTYDDFVRCVIASAAIPGFAKPVDIFGFKKVDGGWNEPIPTSIIAERYSQDHIEIFLTHSIRDEHPIYNPIRGAFKIIKMLFRRLSDAGINNRVKCLERLRTMKLPNCYVYYNTYSPYSAADFNKERMRERIQIGRRRVRLNTLNPIKL